MIIAGPKMLTGNRIPYHNLFQAALHPAPGTQHPTPGTRHKNLPAAKQSPDYLNFDKIIQATKQWASTRTINQISIH